MIVLIFFQVEHVHEESMFQNLWPLCSSIHTCSIVVHHKFFGSTDIELQVILLHHMTKLYISHRMYESGQTWMEMWPVQGGNSSSKQCSWLVFCVSCLILSGWYLDVIHKCVQTEGHCVASSQSVIHVCWAAEETVRRKQRNLKLHYIIPLIKTVIVLKV